MSLISNSFEFTFYGSCSLSTCAVVGEGEE